MGVKKVASTSGAFPGGKLERSMRPSALRRRSFGKGRAKKSVGMTPPRGTSNSAVVPVTVPPSELGPPSRPVPLEPVPKLQAAANKKSATKPHRLIDHLVKDAAERGG